jgi:THO complex subunit 1
MPSFEMENPLILGVDAVDSLFDELLQYAETVKQTTSIDPALTSTDFEDLSARLGQALAPAAAQNGDDNADLSRARRYAIVETVARDKFSNLIVSGEGAAAHNDGTLTSTLGDNIHQLSGLC